MSAPTAENLTVGPWTPVRCCEACILEEFLLDHGLMERGKPRYPFLTAHLEKQLFWELVDLGLVETRNRQGRQVRALVPPAQIADAARALLVAEDAEWRLGKSPWKP